MLYRFADFVLDMDRRELRRGSQLVAIAPQVFDLLEYLIKNRNRVVSKDDLIAAIWDGRIVSETALSTRINVVRCAIDDSGEDQRFIRTLPRKGVRFVGSVQEVQEPEAPDAAQAATEQSRPALALPDRPSIAVLPFTNMSDDPQQDYFADGMVEEIITALSRLRWLFVIARNSSFTYKGRAVDVKQVGRELGVRYVLEGSVRKSANRVYHRTAHRCFDWSPYLGRPLRRSHRRHFRSAGSSYGDRGWRNRAQNGTSRNRARQAQADRKSGCL